MSQDQTARIPDAPLPHVPDAPPLDHAASDDACVQRLAELLAHRDERDFDKVVALISRLVVPIEGI
jgi:hypothetical protein